MKKNQLKKFAGKFLAGACVVAMLAGCGAGNASDAMSYKSTSSEAYSLNSGAYSGDAAYGSAKYESNYDESLWSEGEITEPMAPEKEDYSNTAASKRKLIKNVNMNVETQEYETLMANLEKRVKELGGYVQNLESFNGNSYSFYVKRNASVKRYANLTIRIPEQKLDEFVNSISDLANVVNRKESVEDVTLQYVDVKSHKESLQIEQERLLELLERAETLEDIITLENRLTSVRYQIENMESTLRTYDDLVDYSTVTLRVDEVEIYTPVEEKKETNWERMSRGFLESIEDVKDGAVNFVIWVVVNLPYLVIWAIVITIAIFVIKKNLKKKKAKKSEKQSFAEDSNDAPEKTKGQSGEKDAKEARKKEDKK